MRFKEGGLTIDLSLSHNLVLKSETNLYKNHTKSNVLTRDTKWMIAINPFSKSIRFSKTPLNALYESQDKDYMEKYL